MDVGITTDVVEVDVGVGIGIGIGVDVDVDVVVVVDDVVVDVDVDVGVGVGVEEDGARRVFRVKVSTSSDSHESRTTKYHTVMRRIEVVIRT